MEHKYINSIDTEKKEAVMLLYGNVGNEINGNYIAEEIKWLEEQGIETIVERINSGGGSVINGLSIVSANMQSKCKIHTINDGIAASMGGIILMSGDKVSGADFSLLMIHEPSIGWETIETTRDDKTKRGLLAIRDQLSTIIQNRSGKTKEEVDSIMNKETWYTAAECINNGFIDDIVEYAKKPKISNEMSIDEMINTVSNFHNSNNQKSNKMDKLINHFSLESEATIEDVLAKVQEIEANNEEISNKLAEKETQNNELQEKVEGLESEKNDLTEKIENAELINAENEKKLNEYFINEVSLFVDECIKQGKFKKEDSKELIDEALVDFDAFKKLVDKIKVQHVNILDVIQDVEDDPRADWNHIDWQKNDPKGLAEMKKNDPEKEKELYNKTYKK